MSMPTIIDRPPDAGQIVEVRQRRFIVTDVKRSSLPPDRLNESLAAPQHLVTLNCIDDDGYGETNRVIWELEVGARVHERVALPSPVDGFDDPRSCSCPCGTPPTNENGASMHDLSLAALRVARSGCIWCCEPVPEFDPGVPRHHPLSRPSGAARTAESLLRGHPARPLREESMEVLYSRCAGVDVHKKTVVVCRIIPGPDGKPIKEIRTFTTMTRDLLALSDWLTEGGVTHVAMESTGVYWKPVYNLLEGTFTLLLVNAAHIQQVPGRKSDVKDCAWIADLLRHGLLKGSFVPDRPQRELRELTRYRTALVRERAAEQNRVPKTLEGANIKLSAVATDLMGVSARQMLAALCTGRRDLEAIAP